MPTIAYRRDDGRHRAVIRIVGPFDQEKVLQCLAQHEQSGHWSYGLLWDMREMTGAAPLDTLREFAEMIRLKREQRGPVAFLATDPEIYASACAYVALPRRRGAMEVFRDKRDAETWLDEHLAPDIPPA